MIGPYTEYQKELSTRILELRDQKKLTFDQIATLLRAEGYKSPRGHELGAEHVFSIYKKRNLRDVRLNAPATVTIQNVSVEIHR